MASSLDILPTLLGLLGAEEPELGTHGFDLSNLLLNNHKVGATIRLKGTSGFANKVQRFQKLHSKTYQLLQ